MKLYQITAIIAISAAGISACKKQSADIKVSDSTVTPGTTAPAVPATPPTTVPPVDTSAKPATTAPVGRDTTSLFKDAPKSKAAAYSKADIDKGIADYEKLVDKATDLYKKSKTDKSAEAEFNKVLIQAQNAQEVLDGIGTDIKPDQAARLAKAEQKMMSMYGQ